MLKKLIFLSLGLAMAFGASAQIGNNAGHIKNIARAKSVSFPASDVQYWVGSGSNSAVVVVGWDDNPNGNFALAWGVHWNGNTTALGLIDSIATHDSRFSYTYSSSLMGEVSYNDGTLVSGSSTYGWCYYLNGSWAMNAYGNQSVSDGDLIEVSSSCSFTMTSAVAASNPNGGSSSDPVDATIAFSDILFWVGSGSDSAAFIVNFAQPDTAFAWGYLFNGSTTAQAMIDAIDAADPRFWTVGSPSLNGDIHFVTDNDDTLGLSPADPSVGYNFWWTNLNGVSADAGAGSTMHNGDVFKYGDMNSAIGWDPLGTYFLQEAWTKAPTPVPVPSNDPTVEEATIAASDILYWIGEGQNQVVMAVNWPDTALAWGYRFDGTKTVGDMMNDIVATDPRLSIVPGAYGIDDILFVCNSGDTLRRLATSFWGSTNNGVTDMGMSQPLADGDFEKWADGSTGVLVDSNWVEDWGGYWNYIYVYPMTISPVSVPLPVEATIAASEILYWVGEGQNEVVLAVNWPTRALAWGYRFDGNKTVGDMMNDIAAADPRFSIVPGTYGIDDILFVTVAGDTLRRQATNWWGSTNNGVMDMGMVQPLADGDFEKWAESSTGILVDSAWVEDWGAYNYIYVYPMPVLPVSAPIVSGPFCGAVGTEGCNAIAANSAAIKAWATGCVVERGYQVISTAAAYASYGADSMAVGPVDMSDNLTVVSLGDAGRATLTFDSPIVNGEGYDFAVYENSFGDAFLELAFVEVSSDGERFVRFPAISLTQTEVQTGGNGSTDPTMINNLAGKFRMGYGTPFDLNELRDSIGLDINNITHVRIVDVVGSIDPEYGTRDSEGRLINDPWPTPGGSSGFDLAGVAVLNQKVEAVDMANGISLSVYPNPASERVSIVLNGSESAEAILFDINGRAVSTVTLHEGQNTVEISNLPKGVYMLRTNGAVHKIIKK